MFFVQVQAQSLGIYDSAHHEYAYEREYLFKVVQKNHFGISEGVPRFKEVRGRRWWLIHKNDPKGKSTMDVYPRT